MLPLWNMLGQGQTGQISDILAKQFALSQEQAQEAVNALLPAFSLGLKRSATDPLGFSALLAAVSSGRYAEYFQDASRAFSSQGIADGNAVLQKLFGSADLTRAVAAQAAQATGLAQDALKGMLPGLAAMTMGGFFKQFSDAFQTHAGLNPFAAMVGAGLPGASARKEPAPGTKTPDPFAAAFAANPWTKAMGDLWGAAPATGSEAQAPVNPFADAMAQWAAAFSAPPMRHAPPAAEEPAPSNPFGNAVDAMFETGRKQREGYRQALNGLFEQCGPGPRPTASAM